jgi:DNA-binding transcriptional regulator GbsR (MarR family)
MAEPTRPTDAELRVADVVGRLMEFWGFKAVMGRLWGILYLSPDPLPAAELQERLSISAGAASMALTELQKWGVVRKTWRPGERKDFYEAETSIWKMVSRVYREREMGFIREAIDVFEGALKTARAARPRAGAEEKRRIKFIEDRLGRLLSLARVAEALLNMLLSGERIDPTPLRSLIAGAVDPE